MKTILGLVLLTGYVYAQEPMKSIRRDSLPRVFPPNLMPNENFPEPMPNARPGNSFYRNPRDPQNVVRATLDNMPVKVPDTSVTYILGQSYKPYRPPAEPPLQFLKPTPRIIPKRF